MRQLRKFFEYLVASPPLEGEDEERVLAKRLLCTLLMVGGASFVWILPFHAFIGGTRAIGFELLHAAIVFSGVIWLRVTGRSFQFTLISQAIAVMSLAFLSTISMGGFMQAGGRFMWALLGPMAIIVLRRDSRFPYRWMGGYLALLIVLILGGDAMWSAPPPDPRNVRILAIGHFGTVCTLLLGVLWIYVKESREARWATQLHFEEAEAARAEAEQANRAKSRFLAGTSHELRTPLNAIIGYSEMLREDADDAGEVDSVHDIEKILGAARHLLELINGVLDLAKIEAGKMNVHVEEFDVAEVARAVESIAKPLIKKNENALELDMSEGVGRMESDLTKLRQMLFNLISNAAKFTERGTIRLEVTRSRRESTDWLTFAVSDSGIGMTPEQLELVFEEFSQAEATTTRDYGGTGLGLPITRKFCELLGGSIRAESEVGKGSCFEIHLPAKTEVKHTLE